MRAAIVSVAFSIHLFWFSDYAVLQAKESITKIMIAGDKDSLAEGFTFSPDGKYVAIARSKHEGKSEISIYSGKSGEFIGKYFSHFERSNCILFTHNSSQIILGSPDGRCEVWNLDKYALSFVLANKFKSMTNLALSPDGSLLASSGTEGDVVVWNISNQKVVAEFKPHTSQIFAIAMFADNNRVISTGADKSVVLWDIKKNKKISAFNGHSKIVRSFDISADGKGLFTVSDDCYVKLWNIEKEAEIASWYLGHNKPIAVKAHPKGDRLIVGTWSGEFVVYNISDKALSPTHLNDVTVTETKILAHSFPISLVAISFDGQTVATGSVLDKNIWLWRNLP